MSKMQKNSENFLMERHENVVKNISVKKHLFKHGLLLLDLGFISRRNSTLISFDHINFCSKFLLISFILNFISKSLLQSQKSSGLQIFRSSVLIQNWISLYMCCSISFAVEFFLNILKYPSFFFFSSS